MSSPATGMESAYAPHPGECVRDRAAVIAVWRDNLGSPQRHAAKYDWFYLGCPWGQPLLMLMRHEPSATWIGTCAAGPRRMAWQGREIRAGVLVDMAVSARHRTLGPALMMQSALIAAAEQRFDLIYGFPNPKSLAVAKRLEYTLVGELVRYARVLRYRHYLERLLPRRVAAPVAWIVDMGDRLRATLQRRKRRDAVVIAAWQTRADARMDALWWRSPHGEGPVTIRDAAFLHWRFDSFSAVDTRYLVLAPADDTSTLLGWFACQGIGDTLYVRDFWSEAGTAGLARPLLAALVRAAREGGYSAISVEYHGAVEIVAALRASGFHERGRRPVIVRWVGAKRAAPPRFPHLTDADEDE